MEVQTAAPSATSSTLIKIPTELIKDKQKVTVRFQATTGKRDPDRLRGSHDSGRRRVDEEGVRVRIRRTNSGLTLEPQRNEGLVQCPSNFSLS